MIDKKTKEAANNLLTDIKNALSGVKIKPKFKIMWIEDAHDLIKICQLILSDEEKKVVKYIDRVDSDVEEALPKRIMSWYWELRRPIKEYDNVK